MFLDASVGGTIRTLAEPQVKELIEKMSLNEYNFENTRGFENVETKSRSHNELTLGGYKELLKKLELLNQKLNVESTTQESLNEVVFLLCSNCGEEHFAGNYVKEQLVGEVQPISINSHHGSLQTDAEVKISSLEETQTQFMLVTQNEFLKVNKLQNLLNKKHEESMKRLEGQMSSLSQKITSLEKERGNYDTI